MFFFVWKVLKGSGNMKTTSQSFRFYLMVKHCARIAFLPWPKYTFHDLATAQDTIDGRRFQRMSEQLSRTQSGQKLLTQKPKLSVSSINWTYLSQLPEHTFGHAVWLHFSTHNLFEEPDLGVPQINWGPDAEYIKDRYRQTHDFRHVLLGLGITGKEEVLLNIFQASQFFLLLNALIGFFGLLKHGWHHPIHTLRSAIKAIKIGRNSQFTMELPYEELWDQDLNELRKKLNIVPIGLLYQTDNEVRNQPRELVHGHEIS